MDDVKWNIPGTASAVDPRPLAFVGLVKLIRRNVEDKAAS